MRRAALVVCLLLAGVLLAPATADARFAVPRNSLQLIVASSSTTDPANYLVTLETYERSEPGARWHRAYGPWPAETGYGHLLTSRVEGDGSTPIGEWGLGMTIYGNEPAPGGLHYAYHHLVCGDWWDEDPFSPRYNRFVSVPCQIRPGFWSWSEALWTETTAYPYFAVIKFNMDPTIGGSEAPGSGIFLHSWVGGATAGCVALHEPELLRVLRWIRPSAHPEIEIGLSGQVTDVSSQAASR